MKRYLARKVVHGGKEYGLSIVTVQRHADMTWHVDVEKFVREICSTVYYGGTIIICDPTDNTKAYTESTEAPTLLFVP